MPTPRADALRVDDLTVTYGDVRATDGLSLRAAVGSVTAVLGPNGAGKTTTLEVCEGLRQPRSGRVSVLGRDPWRAPASHRARVGVMLQRAGLPSGIRAVEAVRSAAGLFADPYPVDELVDRLALGPLARRPFRRLSGGEQQRVCLAVALVGRPELLLLDEPTSGMDPVARRDTWELIQAFADQGATVVVTTHQIDEAEAVADEVALIAAGRCVVQDAPDRLTRGSSILEFSAAPSLELGTLHGTGREATEVSPGRYRVESSSDAGLLEAVVAWCAGHGTAPVDVVTRRRSLEDVVIDLIDWDGSDVD